MCNVFVVDYLVLHRLYNAGFVWLWASLTVVGSGWTMVPIAATAAHPKLRTHAFRLVGVLAVVAALVFTLKALFGRARPCTSLADIHALVFAAPTDPSFPSGHAAGAFAVAAYVALETRAHAGIKVILFVISTGIALSRVVLGVHYPSDIAAGAVLGVAAAFVISVLRKSFATKMRNSEPAPRIS
jgi:undecaprenyl-diphosphatase